MLCTFRGIYSLPCDAGLSIATNIKPGQKGYDIAYIHVHNTNQSSCELTEEHFTRILDLVVAHKGKTHNFFWYFVCDSVDVVLTDNQKSGKSIMRYCIQLC